MVQQLSQDFVLELSEVGFAGNLEDFWDPTSIKLLDGFVDFDECVSQSARDGSACSTLAGAHKARKTKTCDSATDRISYVGFISPRWDVS